MFSSVTISEDEYLRLKEKAGEVIRKDFNACVQNGHVWKLIGGANAGCSDDCACSRLVHECIVCGDCDYGINDESDDIVANCSEREELEWQDKLDAEMREIVYHQEMSDNKASDQDLMSEIYN